jgi:hypothetical protein
VREWCGRHLSEHVASLLGRRRSREGRSSGGFRARSGEDEAANEPPSKWPPVCGFSGPMVALKRPAQRGGSVRSGKPGAERPRTLADLTDRQFIDGYLKPHAGKCDDEGLHVRRIVLEEAARRIEERSNDA